MDIVLLFLLNTLVFGISFFIVARRLNKSYNTKTFLKEIDLEVKQIMTAFNQTSEEHIQILEDRIEKLHSLKAETEILIKKLENLKDSPIKSVEPRPIIPPPVMPQRIVPNYVPDPVGQEVPIEHNPRMDVIRLANQGMSPSMISQITGIPLGETELIISLRGRA